ncbi:MAG: O-methyltransferase [Cyclobacteriaceae bacterium]|jgi:O-methyltransferase
MPIHPFLVKSKLYKPLLKITTPFKRLHQYLNYLQWVDRHNVIKAFNDYYNPQASYSRRYQLHDHLIKKLGLENTPISYYEFGVAAGEMISFWLGQNNNTNSEFYGFDSFKGLPESWENKQEGHFNKKGQTPNISDPRVKFISGWFQDTVYEFFKNHKPSNNTTIFHLDADLFSSTLYVLFHIQPIIKSGDILIFDEFSSFNDEYEALEIFKRCFGKPFDYELLGAINNYRQVAIQLK